MSHDSTRVVTARWILPVSSEGFNGGWIRLQGNQVVEIGKGRPPMPAEDLGDVALLPGLINAHTHLEFSDCQQPIDSPGTPLHQWIGQVIAARSQTTVDSKRLAIARGMSESTEAGVRLIGEITTPPCHYPSDETLPELVAFAEVLGLSVQRGRERMQAAEDHHAIDACAAWSPHAPYSTSLEVIDWCVERAAQSGRPLAMHVAESPAERELLSSGTGPFAESLRALGLWREDLFPWQDPPYNALIDRLARAPRCLLIHGNDLRNDEIERLRHYPHASVVFCPRTHAFFGYESHPVNRLLDAGVRVALGTDSRASNPDLNLWREVQFLLKQRTDLAPHQVLQMATIHGADALGRSDMGRIEIGCHGGLGFVRTEAATIEGVHEDFSQGDYIALN